MRSAAALLLLLAHAVAGPKENLPADCVVVTHVDFAALRKTEVWGRVAKPIDEFLKEQMGFEGLFEGMGLVSERDLVSVTFALGGDLATDSQRIYAIARGTFDAKKLAECFASSGIKPVERDGMTVFEDKELQGKRYCGFTGAFGLVGGGVLLYTNPAKGIDALGAAVREGAPPSDIAKVLEAAPEAHAWTVFLPTPAVREALRKEPEVAPIAALKSAVLSYRLGPQIDVSLSAEAESEDLAKQVGVIAQAGLMGLGLKERAKLECKGAVLTGSLAIPLEEAMTMMGMPLDSPEKPGTSALPVVAEGAPKLEGKGRLLRLALPGQVNLLAATPDGKHVFVDRAQESDVVLDAELRVVGKVRDAWGRMGFTLDGKLGLWPRGGKAEIRTIPDLASTHRIERPAHSFDDPWAVCALPDGKTFAVAGWDEVRLFHMDPPRWGEAGKAGISQPIAGAVDPKTGLLVMIGDGTWFEVFDARTLKSVVTLALPRRTTYDVVAAGGRAWVGMKDGTILPVDIAEQKVLDAVRVADGGDVRLAMSGSGRVLVAAAEKRVDRDHHQIRVAAYEIDSLELREVAAAGFVSPCPFNDMALLEGSRTVLLGGRESFVWRYEGSD